MKRIAAVAAKNAIPLLFCLFLFLSLIRIRFGGLPRTRNGCRST
mgnify:CR=1 FL=1